MRSESFYGYFYAVTGGRPGAMEGSRKGEGHWRPGERWAGPFKRRVTMGRPGREDSEEQAGSSDSAGRGDGRNSFRRMVGGAGQEASDRRRGGAAG
jgi:hypothetical protein